jgi:hypothetical protein
VGAAVSGVVEPQVWDVPSIVVQLIAHRAIARDMARWLELKGLAVPMDGAPVAEYVAAIRAWAEDR